MPLSLHPSDALLVIDMQVDFLPGGPLAVADGDAIIPAINALGSRFDHVLLTQDWHPAGHISFASTHGKRPYDTIHTPYGLQHLWPDHCVQGTPGAALHPALHLPHAELLLRKGFRPDIDSYSAFTENDGTTPTGLAGYLRERGLTRLFFTGLAYDFCVGFSALAAARLGFEAIVLEDLTRPVDLPESPDLPRTPDLPGTVAQTNAAFTSAGIPRLQTADLA